MRQPAEIFIELTAQELLAPAIARQPIKVHDVGAADLSITSAAANAAAPSTVSAADCIEIELTPQEMDALLSGDFSPLETL